MSKYGERLSLAPRWIVRMSNGFCISTSGVDVVVG
jgi:hypothetical protein